MYQIEIDDEAILLEKDRYTIGRSEACDITIKLEGMSRHHATLTKTPQGWLLQDGDGEKPSSNGTFINNRPITGGIVEPGDELQFNGSAIARFGLAKPEIEPPTMLEAPTTPGNFGPQFLELTQRFERSHAENKAFHDDLASKFAELSTQVRELMQLPPRIESLEEQARHAEGVDQRFAILLHKFQEDIRKACSVGLWAGGLIALVTFGSLVFREAERKQFMGAFVAALGGPEGVGTGLAVLVFGGGAIAVNPNKGKNVRDDSTDLRLGGGEPPQSMGGTGSINRTDSSLGGFD